VNERVETVIVGAGQAGLAMSCQLGQRGREHVVLERGRIGEAWLSERWDSMVFQFPNWTLQLPGFVYEGPDPHGFAPRAEVARFLEDYADWLRAPVRTGVRVLSLRKDNGRERFLIQTDDATIEARNVVVAIGSFHRPWLPAYAEGVPAGVLQLHSMHYRNPGELPAGAVLVVGCGASGAQIAEELYRSGRRVFLSVGRYRRAPRRYRGRDVFWWLEALGIWDRPVDLHPEVADWRVPLVTGVEGGHDIDLRRFRSDGVTLLGRVSGVSGRRLTLAPGLEATLQAGDEWFTDFTQQADDHARHRHSDVADPEPARQPPPHVPQSAASIGDLDLKAAGITSLIWAGGFRYDFSWIHVPVFDDAGNPRQHRGVTTCPGLYFLGLRRMYTLNSAILSGVGKDAAYLAAQISQRA
jgi:putative flavoprotein involved in K+ transport